MRAVARRRHQRCVENRQRARPDEFAKIGNLARQKRDVRGLAVIALLQGVIRHRVRGAHFRPIGLMIVRMWLRKMIDWSPPSAAPAGLGLLALPDCPALPLDLAPAPFAAGPFFPATISVSPGRAWPEA